MTVSNSFSSVTKGLANFQKGISKGNKVFKAISRGINTVSNSPITRFVETNVPALRPLIKNVKSGNDRLKQIGNSLEKAEKKVTEVKKVIDFR